MREAMMAISFDDLARAAELSAGRRVLTLTAPQGSKLDLQLHDACREGTEVTLESPTLLGQTFVVMGCAPTGRSNEVQYTLGVAKRPERLPHQADLSIGYQRGLAYQRALARADARTDAAVSPLTPAQEAAQRALRQPQHRRAGLLGLDSVPEWVGP